MSQRPGERDAGGEEVVPARAAECAAAASCRDARGFAPVQGQQGGACHEARPAVASPSGAQDALLAGSVAGCGLFPLAPVTVVVGHYGVGKTNLALNLALDAMARGQQVTLVDLDVVNPYFRSSEYAQLLETHGVRLVAPVYARSGTNLDVPSLTGAIEPAIEAAYAACAAGARRGKGAATSSAARAGGAEECEAGAPAHGGEWPGARGADPAAGGAPRAVIIDAGGDDVGATVLGRFAAAISAGPYDLLYVVNRYRNLTQTPAEALEVLAAIEQKSRLSATAIVNNSHVQGDTDEEAIVQALPFARRVAAQANVPLVCTTVPAALARREIPRVSAFEGVGCTYPVQIYVRTPWEAGGAAARA